MICPLYAAYRAIIHRIATTWLNPYAGGLLRGIPMALHALIKREGAQVMRSKRVNDWNPIK